MKNIKNKKKLKMKQNMLKINFDYASNINIVEYIRKLTKKNVRIDLPDHMHTFPNNTDNLLPSQLNHLHIKITSNKAFIPDNYLNKFFDTFLNLKSLNKYKKIYFMVDDVKYSLDLFGDECSLWIMHSNTDAPHLSSILLRYNYNYIKPIHTFTIKNLFYLELLNEEHINKLYNELNNILIKYL